MKLQGSSPQQFRSRLEADLHKEASALVNTPASQAAVPVNDVEGCASARSAPRSLPCLYSHKCIEGREESGVKLTGSQKRTAHSLALEVNWLCKDYGLENCLFLTLTMGGHNSPTIQDLNHRFKSLRSNVLADRYGRIVGVNERGELRGRWHMHLAMGGRQDVRTGFDWSAQEEIYRIEQRYRRNGWGRAYLKDEEWLAASARRNASASPALRAEWRFWREMAPRYGFGSRTEILPIKSDADGIAYYVGGYIRKGLEHQDPKDKGARRVRFVNYGSAEIFADPLSAPWQGPGEPKRERVSQRRTSSRFAWNSPGARLWRVKVDAWAALMGLDDYDALKAVCGPRWAYHFKEDILATELPPGTLLDEETAAKALLPVSERASHRARVQDQADQAGVVRTVLLDESRVRTPC